MWIIPMKRQISMILIFELFIRTLLTFGKTEVCYSILWCVVYGSIIFNRLENVIALFFPDIFLFLFFGTIFEQVFLIHDSLVNIWTVVCRKFGFSPINLIINRWSRQTRSWISSTFSFIIESALNHGKIWTLNKTLSP